LFHERLVVVKQAPLVQLELVQLEPPLQVQVVPQVVQLELLLVVAP
jgi:hypothetical protein